MQTEYVFVSCFFVTLDFSPLRPREHHLLVSAGTRRTPCAVAVAPKLTTCRSPPAASVATLRSARESVNVSVFSLQGTVLSFKLFHWQETEGFKVIARTKMSGSFISLQLQNNSRMMFGSVDATVPCFHNIYFADNWSAKAKRRNTTGTGRLRHLKVVYRRFR